MKEHIQFGNWHVEIWRRPYQRSLNLRVRPDGKIRVTCGRSVPRTAVEMFVVESREFITKRQGELETIRREHPEKKFVSDETFLYFGEPWPLDVIWTWNTKTTVTTQEGRLEMKAPLESSVEERRKAMNAFYKKQAKLHLVERVDLFAAQTGLKPASLSFRGQRTRWGSCSARKQISLNWKLLAAPEMIIDYVVIHELAHLRFLDHSAEFWALVERYFPEYRQARKWLREHESQIARQFGADA